MANIFLFQDTIERVTEEISNRLQLLEEEDVVVPKKKKKYFPRKTETPDSIPPLLTQTKIDSLSSSVSAPQKKDISEKIVFTNSIFSNHSLSQKNALPKALSVENQDWSTFLVFAAVAMPAMFSAFSRKAFRSNFKLLFSGKAVTQMMREERSFMNRVSLLLLTSFLVVFSLFLFHVSSYLGIAAAKNTPLYFYLKIAGVVLLLYAIKVVALKLAGFVFEATKMMNENIFHLFLFTEMLGVFLLPIIIGISFIESIHPKLFIYSGLILWALIFIYRNFRSWVSQCAMEQVSKYYLLLYLCTLEILPLIVLVKFFNK